MHKKILGEKQLKESLFAYWFIRTFVQYIEYNVPSYRWKSKKPNKIEYLIIIIIIIKENQIYDISINTNKNKRYIISLLQCFMDVAGIIS